MMRMRRDMGQTTTPHSMQAQSIIHKGRGVEWTAGAGSQVPDLPTPQAMVQPIANCLQSN